MRKYNKPEIVALALETVDVIETSGARVGANALAGEQGGFTANTGQIEKQITEMNQTWSW